MTDRTTNSSTAGGDSAAADGRADRAQSSVLAIVLLVGLTFVGAATVVLVGSVALDDGQQQADIQSAENDLAQVNAKANRVALGTNNTEQVVVGSGGSGTTEVQPGMGRVKITLVNQTTGDDVDVLLNDSLGRIVYELDGERVAFQGGGVWRKTGENSSRMLSRPDVHYRNDEADQPTVTVPLTIIGGTAGSGNELTLSDAGTDLRYPISGNENRTNPITSNTQVNVTVQSEYYKAWGAYFADLTDGAAEYDHENNEVSIALITPADREVVSKALLQTGADSDLVFSNKAVVDSYNSTGYWNPYDDSKAVNGENGTITTAGNVVINNKGKVYGDIVAGGYVQVQKKHGLVTGNISYGNAGDTYINNGAFQGEWTANNASVVSTPSIRNYVTSTFARIESDSDNADEPELQGNSTVFTHNGNGTIVLHGGPEGKDYYIENGLDMDGSDKLILNTTKGNVRLGIRQSLSLDSDANITVVGNNTARIFVEDDFTMGTDARTHVPGDKAPRLWVYGTDGTTTTFSNHASFTGVVYAPGSNNVNIDGHANMYGGVVGGGDANVGNDGQLHFDEALTGVRPVPEDESIPYITHLHLSVNYVTVTAD
ncbi:polymer-forming cytoskeletal protein [Halostella litorea]|uniref:polymer-forming cytoskeletal protein n=1 Tax=Halostella litorea TaxID=2528831 RepID=UPI00109314CD|nr:polymer-forming cytoskeletal protein [Halostella litorea]